MVKVSPEQEGKQKKHALANVRRAYGAKRTGDSEVRVGLDFSTQVAGEALKHPGVIRNKAINLQTASHQHLVAWGLHSANGHSVLIPNNVWLRNT